MNKFYAAFEQILIVVFYVLAAKFGLQFATINANASPLWPATGVAVGLVYLRGYKIFFAIWAGAFIANLGTGLPYYSVGLIATGNSLEAVLALFVFRHLQPLLQHKARYHSRVLLYTAMATAPTLISASFGTLALLLGGVLTLSTAWISFLTWWIGDGLGLLLVFPLLYEAKEALQDPRWKERLAPFLKAGRLVKSLGALGLLILGAHFVFGTTLGNPFLFLIFFAFLAIVQCLPFWCVYLAAIFVSGYSIGMTSLGLGPFRSGETNESLLHLEFFLAAVWLTVIVLSNLKQDGYLRRASWTFSIGWLLTGATFFAFYEASHRRAVNGFESKTKEATLVIQNAMESYVRLLEAGSSFIKASDLVTAKDWNDFTTGLNFSARYPGLKGMGVIYPVEVSKLPEFEKKYGREQQGFKVHNVFNSTQEHLEGVSERFVIVYIEPKAQNAAAVGLDISSQAMRYETALRARDLNQPALTKDIQLQQSPQSGPGFLLLFPFYYRDADLSSVEGRRKGLRGFVYAPVEGAVFFKNATARFEKELELVNFKTNGSADADLNHKPESYTETQATLAGVTFELLWKNKNSKPIQGTLAASLAGFCGAFFTLVLAILVASLEGISSEAQKLADKMTEEVRERERRWRALTESSPVGVFSTDADSKLTYVNQRWTTITGLTFGELLEGKIREVIHPDDIQRVYEEWERFTAGKTSAYESNYRLRVDGKWRHVCCNALEVRSDQGERLGFLGTLQDLTDLHNNQVALAAASRLSSLGQMAGGIAHEINTPLAVISTKVELMKMMLEKSDPEKDKLKEQLTKIYETVHRIAKIVRGLKSIAREPSEEKPVLFSAKRVLLDAWELSEKRFADAGIELRTQEDLNEEVQVLGHPEQISQVLLNLFNNSYDAVINMPEKWVAVTCSQDADNVRIEVSDSGALINSEVRENLFHPFFTTKKTGEGTGLGLSISKALIEKWGGRLYFESNRQNTTFVIELPLSKTREAGSDAKI